MRLSVDAFGKLNNLTFCENEEESERRSMNNKIRVSVILKDEITK